jgi:ATP-dependent DNA helicase DinG
LRLGLPEIRRIFGPGGTLSKEIAEYEVRPQQTEFAGQVLEILRDGGSLVIEAATGVGKSLGYLIPSVAVSLSRQSPVLISTNTKNLQEQLINNDVPIATGIFRGGFKAAVLKGRGNYLCLRKWQQLLEGERNKRVEDFVETISSSLPSFPCGDLAEKGYARDFSLWERVTSDPTTCLSSACLHAGSCYWRKARRKASQADIVIVNHSLLFSDVGCERTLLPEHDTIIMDEAHNVERVATEHFGVEVTGARVKREVDRLVSTAGLFQSVRRKLGRRLPKLRRLAISSKIQEIDGVLEEFSGVSNTAYSRLLELLEAMGACSSVRFGDDRLSLPGAFQEMAFACSRVEELLSGLLSNVRENAELIKDTEELVAEITGASERWKSLTSDLVFLWEASRPEFVYWVEQRRGEDLALKACPVWVRDEMREHLFSQLRALILTSATMAVAGSLDHFMFRMGLEGDYEPRCAIIDSPFDYSRQVTVTVPYDFADPRQQQFVASTSELVMKLMEVATHKALVLFTAYDMLGQVYATIAQPLRERGLSVFGQGLNGTRSEIMDAFKSSQKAVLLGAASFWEGIDLPGEALEMVIVVRLPFPVPDEPIVLARSESLLAEGKDPFKDYFLPEAAIRLRQGFGRLIRRKTDRGAVIILDPRITRSSYGSVFTKSLPTVLEPCATSELPDKISAWFRKADGKAERAAGKKIGTTIAEKPGKRTARKTRERTGEKTRRETGERG